MTQTRVTSLRAYMVKMAIDGRVINIELESVNEMVRLMKSDAAENASGICLTNLLGRFEGFQGFIPDK